MGGASDAAVAKEMGALPPDGAGVDHQPPVGAPDAAALPPDSGPPPPPNRTPPIISSRQTGALAAAGLDPLNWPTLEVADRTAHFQIMTTFTGGLGVTCDGCHQGPAYMVWTPNKRVARHMWDDLLVRLVMKDGTPLYCDSCHQGKAKFLDRANRASLELWMQQNFVDKLRRKDGAPHTCATCHGTPAKYDLVEAWGAN